MAEKIGKLKSALKLLELAGASAVVGRFFQSYKSFYSQRLQPGMNTILPGSFPKVSIIVPARNEEKNIEECVRSLLRQDYPNFELIVVNDDSTDRTPEILNRLAAENPRLQVLNLSGNLPGSWVGKAHALWQGVKQISSDSTWLLFTDADTEHNPITLKTAVGTALQTKADLLSIGTYAETPTFWSKLLMPAFTAGFIMIYPPETSEEKNSQFAVANGQYMLVKRGAYGQIGGWKTKALRRSGVDDHDFAMLIKKKGGKVVYRAGLDLVSTTMYETFDEFWSGGSRNIFLGMPAPFLTVPTAMALSFAFCVLPFLRLFANLPKLFSSKEEKRQAARREVLFNGLLVAANLSVRRTVDHKLDVSWLYTALHPFSILVLDGIMLNSLWKAVKQEGIEWKGRSYQNANASIMMENETAVPGKA